MIDTLVNFLQDHWVLSLLLAALAWSKWSARNNAKAMENIPGSLVRKMETDAQWEEGVRAAEVRVAKRGALCIAYSCCVVSSPNPPCLALPCLSL